MNVKLIISLIIFIVTACVNNEKESEKLFSDKYVSVNLKYAKKFKIKKYSEYTVMTILLHDDNSDSINYYLINKNKKIPKYLSTKNIIRTPIERVVCLSTTHVAFINEIKKNSKIKGVSGSKYIYNKEIRKNIASGKIHDTGYDQNIDYELLLSLKPDLVFAYQVMGEASPTVNKMKKLGINVVLVNEYIEPSALGMAEWTKFFAEFFDEQELSKKKFNKIEKSYNKLLNLTDTISNRPDVFVNLPWKGTWYISGGISNISEFIQAAGGNYILSDTTTKHNLPLSIEEVYQLANNADIWINPGQAKTKKDIFNTDKRLQNFTAFKTGMIFNRNARLNENGGNDYMESGTVNPDIILKDLIKIFHPYLMKNHKFYYYRKLDNF